MSAILFVQSLPVRGGYEARLSLTGTCAREIASIIPDGDDTQSKYWIPNGDTNYGWLVHEHVLVTGDAASGIEIKTVAGTGKGQTKIFDLLVGERLSKLRRDLRSTAVENGGDAEQEVSLTYNEVQQMLELLSAHADEQACESVLV